MGYGEKLTKIAENFVKVYNKAYNKGYGEGLAANGGTVGLSYTLSADGSHYICDGIGTATDKDIVIASFLNSIPVTEIADNSFKDRTDITSVTIPDKITSIGKQAFYGCKALANVSIGYGVTSIGGSAFQRCSALGSIEIYGNVKTLSTYVFSECASLVSVKIMHGLERIGAYAFQYCSSLTNITIPESVTSIGSYAFRRCKSLTEIEIPDSVTEISYDAFSGCSSLESITLPFVGLCKDSETVIYPLGYIFGKTSYDGEIATEQEYYYNGNTTAATYYIPSSLKSVTITGGEIAKGAFKNCKYLTDITIPDSITSIGADAFKGCFRLNSITIPESVTSIGDSAFYGCTWLTEIHFNAILLSDVGNNLFYHVGEFTNGVKVTIGANVTKIPNYLFYIGANTLTKITSVEFAENSKCESIGMYAFSYTSLANITIPNSVTKIDSYAFYHCESLTSITIPDSVTTLGQQVFQGCTSLAEVSIGNGITKAGSSLFSECSSLESIILPDSMTGVDTYYMFHNCTKLKSVYIGNGITTLSRRMFYGTSLTSIVIPDSVTYIWSEAFLNCPTLVNIYCMFAENAVTGAPWGASNATIEYNYQREG